MERAFRYLSVERHGPVVVARPTPLVYDDAMLDSLGVEMASLLDVDGCRSIVVVLGPEPPTCLYSVFLAQLLSLKRRLESHGGQLILTNVTEHTRQLLRVTGLEKFFVERPDVAAALASDV